jgi:hypothetical protein
MTTPEQTPDTELEVQELTDENLEEVSGGGNFSQALASDAFTSTYNVIIQGDKHSPGISDLLGD